MFNVLTHFFEKLTSLRAKWDQDLSIEVRTMCGLRLKMSENRDAKFVKKLVAKKTDSKNDQRTKIKLVRWKSYVSAQRYDRSSPWNNIADQVD